MKPTKPYPTDLTDEQWELLKPMLPPDKPRGRKRRVDLRDILKPSSICCVQAVHGGCCHVIFRPGRLSMAMSTDGEIASCSPTSTPPYVSRCAWPRTPGITFGSHHRLAIGQDN